MRIQLAKRISTLFVMLIIAALAANIILQPKPAIAAIVYSMDLCARAVFPSLFPFFVFTQLFVLMGFTKKIGNLINPIMRPFFNVPGSGGVAFVMGIVSGYPMGAKVALDVYLSRLCTYNELMRLLAFCNNSGPLFIIGTVGVAMLGDYHAGVLLYIAHVAASITVGIVLRWYRQSDYRPRTNQPQTAQTDQNFSTAFTQSVESSMLTMIKICGFIMIFSVINVSLMDVFRTISNFFSVFGVDVNASTGILRGIFEITSGVDLLSKLPTAHSPAMLAAISLVVGWGGICVHFQVFSILKGVGAKTYIWGKGLQGVISAIYVLILSNFTNSELATFVADIKKDTHLVGSYTIIQNVLVAFVAVIVAVYLANKFSTSATRFKEK